MILVYVKANYFVFYEIPVEKEGMRKERRGETDEKFAARGSSIDSMLFRANVVNNGRYRYVIPSFKDDEKSSRAVHKIYNGCTIHYCRRGIQR